MGNAVKPVPNLSALYCTRRAKNVGSNGMCLATPASVSNKTDYGSKVSMNSVNLKSKVGSVEVSVRNKN